MPENKTNEPTEKTSVLNSVGGVADHVVGKLILGDGVGGILHYGAKVPGVGTAGRYVVKNVSEGMGRYDYAELKRLAIKELCKVANSGAPVDVAMIRQLALRMGVKHEDLDEIEKLAFKGQTISDNTQQIAAPDPLPA